MSRETTAPDAEPSYRVVTTLLDPDTAPAGELAALYHQRWEIETAFDELKTHARGARIVLLSKTPDLVRQAAYGLLLAHFAVRGLMHEAALGATPTPCDPDTLSFVHAVRVLRRTLPRVAALPLEDQPRALRAILHELCDEWVHSSRGRVVVRGSSRKSVTSRPPARPTTIPICRLHATNYR